jgi:hypothetical protein
MTPTEIQKLWNIPDSKTNNRSYVALGVSASPSGISQTLDLYMEAHGP